MTEEKQKLLDDFGEEDKVNSSNSTFWNFKEEKVIIGLFVRWEKDSFGEHGVLQTEEEVEVHLPNLMALNGKLKAGDIEPSNKVKVEYSGSVKSKTGRLYEDFNIYIKH